MSYSIILRDITDDQIVGYLDIEDILSISIDPASYSSVDFHKQEARRCKIDCIVNGWDSVNTAYSVNTALFQHSINRDYYVRDWVNKDEYDWNYWNDPASAYQINIYSLDERKIITDVPIGRHEVEIKRDGSTIFTGFTYSGTLKYDHYERRLKMEIYDMIKLHNLILSQYNLDNSFAEATTQPPHEYVFPDITPKYDFSDLMYLVTSGFRPYRTQDSDSFIYSTNWISGSAGYNFEDLELNFGNGGHAGVPDIIDETFLPRHWTALSGLHTNFTPHVIIEGTTYNYNFMRLWNGGQGRMNFTYAAFHYRYEMHQGNVTDRWAQWVVYNIRFYSPGQGELSHYYSYNRDEMAGNDNVNDLNNTFADYRDKLGNLGFELDEVLSDDVLELEDIDGNEYVVEPGSPVTLYYDYGDYPTTTFYKDARIFFTNAEGESMVFDGISVQKNCNAKSLLDDLLILGNLAMTTNLYNIRFDTRNISVGGITTISNEDILELEITQERPEYSEFTGFKTLQIDYYPTIVDLINDQWKQEASRYEGRLKMKILNNYNLDILNHIDFENPSDLGFPSGDWEESSFIIFKINTSVNGDYIEIECYRDKEAENGS